jgi:hypothetical protein
LQARYLIAERWPAGPGTPPPLELTSEEEVIGAAMEDLLRYAAAGAH